MMNKRNKTRNLRSAMACMLALLLCLGFCLPFLTKTVKAADTTYTVRVFSGERGGFSGSGNNEVKEFTGLTYGSEFSFQANGLTKNSVKLTDNKYYVRGFRESGKDNSTVGLENFKVTQDIDYVVAYGVAGSTVEYYVNYVDEDGNTLAPSETYYGNVGDKPVVAYLYMDGFFPQARNLTKTLSANATENNFTFVYRQIEEPTTATTEATSETTTATTQATTRAQQQTTQAPAGQTTIIERTVPAATTAAPANPTTPATTAAPGAATTAATTADTTTTAAEPDTTPTNPDEVPDLVDIDDQDTPLADFEDTGDETEETTESDIDISDEEAPRSGLSTPAKIGIGIGAVVGIAAAAGALYYFLVYRSRTTGSDDGMDDDSDDDDDYDD